MSLKLVALSLLVLSAPLAAKPLTVRIGETWIFTVDHGQPANARKALPTTAPARDEIKVSVQPMMGTTMTVTNTSGVDYGYRAVLVLPTGAAGPAKACAVPANGRVAIENWPVRAAAVRLSDFKAAPAGSLCP